MVEPADLLLEVLEDSRRLGFLGAGVTVEDQQAHALGFVRAWEGSHLGTRPPGRTAPPGRALDLGSGGGLPGLVLATAWTRSEWLLLDAREVRVAFLDDAVRRLALSDRVTVLHARAEDASRQAGHRSAYDLVTARSFGPPAVTAECAAPFLRVGGCLIVSEPPESIGERWAYPHSLSELGLEVEESTPGFQALTLRTMCGERYPRRPGIPAKRPLF